MSSKLIPQIHALQRKSHLQFCSFARHVNSITLKPFCVFKNLLTCSKHFILHAQIIFTRERSAYQLSSKPIQLMHALQRLAYLSFRSLARHVNSVFCFVDLKTFLRVLHRRKKCIFSKLISLIHAIQRLSHLPVCFLSLFH
jgi:hypothetical protein